MADEIAKSRNEAIAFCQEQLLIWREKMIKSKNKKQQAVSAQVVKKIQRTLQFLEANVNPKLCLESLLLNMPFSDDPGSSQV